MARRKHRHWLMMVSAASLAVSLATCGGAETCTQATCTSGASMHIPIASSAASLTGASVTACRNVTECYPGPLPAVPSPDSAGASVFFTGTTAVLGTLWQKADLSIGLDLEWHLADPSLAVDGDHYVVTLTDAAGTATPLLDKTASYQTTAPIPNACTPAPACKMSELVP